MSWREINMEQLVLIVALSVVIFAVLYLIIKAAVEDGTFCALVKYDKYKQNTNEVKANDTIDENDADITS
jgi:hypothetical protein